MEEDEGTNMEEQEDTESMGLPPTDNQAELTKFILDPEARKLYKHITKDFAITNLNEEETQYINLNLQLFHLIQYIEETKGDFKLLQNVILQDIYSFLQVSRSKDGFERMAEITKKSDTKQKYTEEKQKKGFLGR